MTSTRLILLVAALAIGGGSAFAQAKREDVKAEATAANKAGATKTAEGTSGPAAKPGASTKTRAERKDEAKMANKDGATKVGEGTSGPAAKAGASTTTRADRKADAAAANKAGATKVGEGEAGKK